MALRLTIENVTNLPDGGPVSFSMTGKRSVDIGRDQHLDWTLPDPTRYISGKHCEIHYRDGSYWLHDVSTNGTFLDGADHRVRSPHELKDRERLVIGHYIIAVSLEVEADASAAQRDAALTSAASRPPPDADLWDSDSAPASPGHEQLVTVPRQAPEPAQPALLDWTGSAAARDVRPVRPGAPVAPPNDAAEVDWAADQPSPANRTFEPAAPAAAPRRFVRQEGLAIAENATPFAATPAMAPAKSSQVQSPGPQAASQPSITSASAPTPVTDAEPRDIDQGFTARIARGASLPEEFFAGKNAEQLAHQLGELMRISVSDLMALLQARNEAKRLTRSGSHTMIQATENNPLKFAPTAEEAMRILFGPKNRSYLDARAALEQAFNDLKVHQQKTYAAMQHAASMLIAELDPAAVAKEADEQGSVLDKVRSRKSRLWDTLVARWKARFGREAGASLEAFMVHFADHYDRKDRRDSE